MALVGVGIDAIEISRVRDAVVRTPGLLARLFTERERGSCVTRCGDLRYGGLAARFAGKEAVAKALGTGVRGFDFRDIEILNDELGKPAVILHRGAAATAAELGVSKVHLSLSTSTEIAMANAVAETSS